MRKKYYFFSGLCLLLATNLCTANGSVWTHCNFVLERIPPPNEQLYFAGFSPNEVAKKCEKVCNNLVHNTGLKKYQCKVLGIDHAATNTNQAPVLHRKEIPMDVELTYLHPVDGSVIDVVTNHFIIANEDTCKEGYEQTSGFDLETFQIGCRLSTCNDGETWDIQTSQCKPSPKQPICPKTGEPISILTGYKYKQQTDIPTSTHGLGLQRFYRSGAIYGLDTVFGGYWRHQYEQQIKLHPAGNILEVVTANGRHLPFQKSGNVWVGDTDSTSTLTELFDTASNRTGWQHHASNNQIERYNAEGQITSIADINGDQLTFDYALGQAAGGDDNTLTLDKVTDASGHSIQFTYSGFLLSSVTDQDGSTYTYSYSYDSAEHLSKVIYPDETPLNDTDNPSITYHYEDTNHPSAVTGITDEQGQRTATWTYDSQGRAISSESGASGSGISLTSMDYTHLDDPVDPRVTETNALGKLTTYHYTTVAGVRKVTQVEGHASTNCAAANKSTTYDSNGFLKSTTDWNGNQATYIYNTRGLEEQRIEAVGTPQQRKTVTQWHPTYRVPTQIDVFDKDNNPLKRTTNTYDPQGRRLNQTIESL